ncbi:MAG: PIN domain-containing protein [Bacteroidales bacterium]|jgi:PIN domain nuclease of toxin-antitoxin system
MYVTDAHGFLWFLSKDKKLGKNALEIFRACDKGKEIVVVPSIVLLECMYVCEKKRIEFEFQEIMQKIQGTFNYPVYPLDEEVILECQSIRQIAEVHDRIIVATAKLLNAKLITRDANITDSKIVETIW